MEALTRLVADSLARHGFDRPVDPRRLQWSRWSRCDSPHSLLVVPSKPGVFALAEEIMDVAPGNAHVGTAAQACPERSRRGCPAEQSSADGTRRMLAILQFSEDDDMAFTLDRMFTRIIPCAPALLRLPCFLRFVVIEDQAQRRSICSAPNQWMLASAEKASGISADFSSSLELASVGRAPLPATADSAPDRLGRTFLSDSADSAPLSAMPTKPAPEKDFAAAPPHLDSGAAKNLHCPHPLPSGF